MSGFAPPPRKMTKRAVKSGSFSRSAWGVWTFDERNMTLDTKAAGYPYYIRLNAPGFDPLDWLSHIDLKRWGTPGVVDDLQRAFTDLGYIKGA